MKSRPGDKLMEIDGFSGEGEMEKAIDEGHRGRERGTFGTLYLKDQLTHTPMKTWGFLSNYKGVCSVLLRGCPAALLTL